MCVPFLSCFLLQTNHSVLQNGCYHWLMSPYPREGALRERQKRINKEKESHNVAILK